MNRAPPPLPTIVGLRPLHRGGIGVKQMQIINRIKKWRIRRQIATHKNIDVKHRGNVVRKMTVQRKAIFPSFRGGVY